MERDERPADAQRVGGLVAADRLAPAVHVVEEASSRRLVERGDGADRIRVEADAGASHQLYRSVSLAQDGLPATQRLTILDNRSRMGPRSVAAAPGATTIQAMLPFTRGRLALDRLTAQRSKAEIAAATVLALAGHDPCRLSHPNRHPRRRARLSARRADGRHALSDRPAVVTSIAAFLVYDFLFVPPVYTFTIATRTNGSTCCSCWPSRWSSAGSRRSRPSEPRRRQTAPSRRSRCTGSPGVLASTRTVGEAAPVVLQRLAESTAMDRVWLGIGPTPSEERIVADTAVDALPVPAVARRSERPPGGQPRWVRTHVSRAGIRRPAASVVHRVRVEVAGEPLGSLWALRSRGRREPDRAETRILAAAADQLGQAVVRDRFSHEAPERRDPPRERGPEVGASRFRVP